MRYLPLVIQFTILRLKKIIMPELPDLQLFDHMVVITGYNNSGTFQYFDPLLAKYKVVDASALTHVREVIRYNLK